MTVPRALSVLAILCGVGVTMVLLRGQTARAAHRVQRLHERQTRARHKLWGLEIELARLRAPDRIGRRAAALGLEVQPPTPDGPPAKSGAHATGD